jgi:hypothetical protein
MGKVLGTLGSAVKVRGTTAQYVVDHTIPGRTLRIPHGMLSLIADDGTVFKSIEANRGGFVSDFRKHNGPIPPGKYRISNFRSPRNDEGTAMRDFDVSFSFSLDPIDTNVFGRDGLDIHPDGPPPGTARVHRPGCANAPAIGGIPRFAEYAHQRRIALVCHCEVHALFRRKLVFARSRRPCYLCKELGIFVRRKSGGTRLRNSGQVRKISFPKRGNERVFPSFAAECFDDSNDPENDSGAQNGKMQKAE